MPTPGKAVVRQSGKRGVNASGKAMVFDQDGCCRSCCPCVPYVLASRVTNSSNPVWDLTPYQGPTKATPCSFWRLIEVGTCYPYAYPWYGAGCVDSDGRLVGLPDQFVTGFAYDGYMELQIGCQSPDGLSILWPGTCQTQSSRSSFPC